MSSINPSFGETIHLTGKVVDGTGAAVPGVLAKLKRWGNSAVTLADGTFLITNEVGIFQSIGPRRFETPKSLGGSLYFPLSQSAQVWLKKIGRAASSAGGTPLDNTYYSTVKIYVFQSDCPQAKVEMADMQRLYPTSPLLVTTQQDLAKSCP